MQSLREKTEGTLHMLLSLRKNGLTSLSKEVRVFKVSSHEHSSGSLCRGINTERKATFLGTFVYMYLTHARVSTDVSNVSGS